MAYLLNGTDLSTFGIIPGRAPSSNIALSGQLDLPVRLNKTAHSWDDQNGVEPYVSAEEIQFAGRDIAFYAYLQGSDKSQIEARFLAFYALLDGFNNLVTFSTPRGDFSVYVKDAIKPVYYTGFATFSVIFREPHPDLTGGTIPDNGDPEDVSGIGGVDFGALGFTVLDFTHLGLRKTSLKGLLDRPAPKTQSAIGYFKEAYQVTKVEALQYTMNGLLEAENYGLLASIVKNLYALFNEPGTRVLYLKNDVIRLVYVKDGFTVKNIQVREKTTALIEINFTEASEHKDGADYQFMGDVIGNYVATTVGQKIVIKI